MAQYKPQSFGWDVAERLHAGAYDHYRDSFADIYEVAGVDQEARAGFASRTNLTLFRAGVIARGRSTAQALIRTPELIRRSGIESVTMTLVNSRMAGDSDGRDVSSQGGTVHLQDLTRPMVSRWESLDIINLTVPRELTERWTGADIHGAVLDGRAGAGRLVANHLRVFADEAANLTDAEGEAAIRAALLIVERALGQETPASDAQVEAVRRTIRETAIRYIRRHLTSPDLSVESIARASAASRSTLYRAFEGHGGVAGQIQRLRLERAREALRLRRDGGPTVTDIAFDHGFASQAHFSRAYRARFGHSPSDEPTLWDSRPAGTGLSFGEIQHDRVADWLREGL